MEDSGLAFAASIFHSLFLAAFRHLKDGGKPVSGVVRLCFGVDGHAGGGSLCVSCLVSSLASRRTLDIGQGTVGYAADVCAVCAECLHGSCGSACDNGEFNENLFKSIDDLELSVRATNCLRSANIALVGELVQRSENEMLKTKNFGKKSLDEIKNVLVDMGLDFGMKVESFDKKYQEWKRKQHHEA